MNRIIVLGSSGYLGTFLREKLSTKKLNVKYMIHKKKIKIDDDEFYGDILNQESLLEA